MKYDNSM